MNMNPKRRQFIQTMLAGAAGGFTLSCASDRARSFFLAPADPDTLIGYDTVDPPTLDPAFSWGVVDGRIIGMIFSTLVRFTPDAQLKPDLAREWTLSDDGRVYTFHLHESAVFSNGRPVLAEDVRYSYERILDPETAAVNPWVLEPIAEIRTPDDHTLQLVLEEPFAPMIYLLAMPAASIVPREAIEQAQQEGIPFGERPLGSGPWRFIEWAHDQYINLERIENYWGASPQFSKYRYRVIPSHFTAIAEFETGNLSFIDQLPDPEIDRWRSHPEWKDYTFTSRVLATDMILFNCEREPFNKPEVRRAFCQLVDTDLMIRSVRNGAGQMSVGPIPPGVTGNTSDRTPFPVNIESARQVLHDHGLADREITMIIPSDQSFLRSTAVVLQALWRKADVNVQVHQLEWVSYRQALRDGDYDTGYRGWFADYPDGDNFLFPLFHSSQIGAGNLCRFQDPRLDELIDRQQRELDQPRREALLREANYYVYQQAPALFLWHRMYYSVIHPWLREYEYPLIFNGTRYLKPHYQPLITPTPVPEVQA